jgi:hypothetical protein
MLHSAAPEGEQFKVIIDEPGLCIVRHNGVVSGQVHSPINLSDLYFQLAAEGYTIADAIAYEDGVIELLCRDLGDLGDLDEVVSGVKVEVATAKQQKERELAYA